MRGWHREKFRHSLAARGISLLGKKSQMIDAKFKSDLHHPGVPTSEQVNAKFARLQKYPDVLGLSADELEKLSEVDRQRRIVAELSDFDMRGQEISQAQEMALERKKSKELLTEVLKLHDEPQINFAAKEEDEWDVLEREYMGGEIDEYTYLKRLNELSAKKKQSLASKDMFGDANEHPLDYIDRSIKANNEHGFDRFWSGVKDLAWHPLQEMDKDWLSYERAARQTPVLSSDRVERATERGAALVGRVVTISNVEPLIDHEDNKNLREALMDVAFGRRLD